jgi:glucose/arabinose dehydrogenase
VPNAVIGRVAFTFVAGLLSAVAAAPAQAMLTTVPGYTDSSVAPVSSPMFITAPPGDPRLFVVERGGQVRVADGGKIIDTPYLDIRAKVATDGERGLSSIAFPPDFAQSHLFYVYYADKSTGDVRIEEFRQSDAAPNVADPASERLVLSITHPALYHYGGTLQFGADGMLYAGTGDGGTGNNAQDLTKLLGKLLRMDVDPVRRGANPYAIPNANPYHANPPCGGGSGSLNCPEVFAYGFRNPFRWSFDRSTRDILIGDVGENSVEEVDWAAEAALPGANFGWNCMEGNNVFTSSTTCSGLSSTFVAPIQTYVHGASGPYAITGGVVVRDPELASTSLDGRYLYVDFYGGQIHSLVPGPNASAGDRVEPLTVTNVASFGEDSAGHVYIVPLYGAKPSRIVCTGGDCGAKVVTPPPAPPPPGPTSDDLPVSSPGPGGTATAADVRAPVIALRAARVQRALRTRSVSLSVVADEACALRLSASLLLGASGSLRLRGSVLTLAARVRRTVHIRLSATQVAAVRGAVARGRSARVGVNATGRDTAGNVRRVRLTIVLQR